jgi:PAS domain S-box-containing protein
MNKKTQNPNGAETPRLPADNHDAQDRKVRLIFQGTAATVGVEFFNALVKNLAEVLSTEGAWVTEFLPESGRLRAMAFWFGDSFIDHYEYDIAGTPCEPVICDGSTVHIPDKITELFPDDPDLEPLGAVSYMGLPLFGTEGEVIGHVAVLDSKPMPEHPEHESLMKIFAARAGAELLRLRAEARAKEREQKLVRLVDSAMDAIIELNNDLVVTRINRAVEKVFDCKSDQLLGCTLEEFLESASFSKVHQLTQELERAPDGRQSLWIPGGLKGKTAGDKSFPAEASLSRFQDQGRTFFTLILRNLNDKQEAERRIKSLEVETRYLREELDRIHGFKSIVGSSPSLCQTLASVRQVAPTDATVLILGETGTGKELVARAVHDSSNRAEHPLIKINCAAIPGTLIESELFGHEKGAFTGATQRRDGRFKLADQGTIFLDEIGELPIDLQAKLLRVLQEGEFEPVGGSSTCRVDVRIIAATNRDLQEAVNKGSFREDLYYRLNVFPITVPPLRERGDDIIELAEAFAADYSQKIGRAFESLSGHDRDHLRAYHWPGNVRELRNVMERAVITADEGRPNIARLISADISDNLQPTASASNSFGPDSRKLLTDSQLRDLERTNILKALDQSGGKISGSKGAAALLGIPPSTLASRMRALKISRPS